MKIVKLRNAIAPNQKSEQDQAVTFATLQAELLAAQSKVGQRAPGRVRVDRIIETGIKLLKDHGRADITIAMIASAGGMTRTSVYAHFTSVDEIFEQISIRFIQQTGIFVERYVREKNPRSLEEVVVLTIDAIQEYFNRPDPQTPGALAAHVPFEARLLVNDFDRISALTYHSLWSVDWPIEPLSEDDPFRLLIVLQSALFETSIQRHGIITDAFVCDAKCMALDFIRRAERRFGKAASSSEPNAVDRITEAASKLLMSGDVRFLDVAAGHLEDLAKLARKN